MIEKATRIIDKNDIGFSFPVPGMVMKHYEASGPPPEWWKEVSDLYAGAMDEMYRGPTRARHGAVHSFCTLQSVWNSAWSTSTASTPSARAGQAKAQGDQEKQLEYLEKAVESMYNALNALSRGRTGQQRSGVIAVVNEYGYRPLKKEFEAAQSK